MSGKWGNVFLSFTRKYCYRNMYTIHHRDSEISVVCGDVLSQDASTLVLFRRDRKYWACRNQEIVLWAETYAQKVDLLPERGFLLQKASDSFPFTSVLFVIDDLCENFSDLVFETILQANDYQQKNLLFPFFQKKIAHDSAAAFFDGLERAITYSRVWFRIVVVCEREVYEDFIQQTYILWKLRAFLK